MVRRTQTACYEFEFPEDTPLKDYRFKMFVGLSLVPDTLILPGTLLSDTVFVTVKPPCGCQDTFKIKDIPLEDLSCPCGSYKYFKFKKTKRKDDH